MRNYVQSDTHITLIAPYALASGEAFQVGSVVAVAKAAAANGASVECLRIGVFDLPTLVSDTPTQGAKAYWDATNKRFTTTATNNTLAGVFYVAKAAGVSTGRIMLDGTIR